MFEIAFERDVKLADNFKKLAKKKRMYYANDDCLLMADEKNSIKVVPGPDIVEHYILDQLMTFAIHHNKTITIADCPNLRHLKKLDKLSVMIENLVDN